MSTYYTFVTELLHEENNIDRVKALEKALADELDREGETHFSYQKVNWRGSVYFTGTNKNTGGGFYEWTNFNTDIRVVWIDDEGGHGDYN